VILGPVAVVGATGTVGSRVVRKLLERGVPVRAIGRHVEGLGGGGATTYQADLTSAREADAAIRGARLVYLTPPESGHEDPVAVERSVALNVIEAATHHEVQHVVMHTALHGDRGTTGVRMLDAKTPMERALASCGTPFTVFRPGWFMQNWLSSKPWLERGTLSMPLAASRHLAAVSADDVATLAVEAFERGAANRGFDLHVPANLTPAQFCDAVEFVLGAPVRFDEWTGSMFDYFAAVPTSPRHKGMFAEFFHYLRQHDYAGRPFDVLDAYPGFSYTSAEAFVRAELFPGMRTPFAAASPASGLEEWIREAQ
jgi:uncharacterized protein YbjT (DUF2867 family)